LVVITASDMKRSLFICDFLKSTTTLNTRNIVQLMDLKLLFPINILQTMEWIFCCLRGNDCFTYSDQKWREANKPFPVTRRVFKKRAKAWAVKIILGPLVQRERERERREGRGGATKECESLPEKESARCVRATASPVDCYA
jgi:hypothetical protein